MEASSPEGITIFDKDDSSEKAVHVVDGFVIEDSKSPFPQNGHLSFVPEDYGKEKPPPPKRTRNHTHSATPAAPHSNGGSAKGSPEDDEEEEELKPGQAKCEFCHIIGDRESFLPPSRRFCSITCCKRYSAEKRYYPYGRDPQGIAKSIREGLLNPRSKHLRGGASKAQKIRDQRRRKMAYYNNSNANTPDQGGGASSDTTATPKTPRGKRGRRTQRKPNASPQHTKRESQHNSSIILEPYTHPTGASLHTWTVDDVGDFLTHLGYEAYLDRFVEHEIDGKALSLVKDHHLLMTLKLRLGPTLKIIENVHAVKIMEEGEIED